MHIRIKLWPDEVLEVADQIKDGFTEAGDVVEEVTWRGHEYEARPVFLFVDDDRGDGCLGFGVELVRVTLGPPTAIREVLAGIES